VIVPVPSRGFCALGLLQVACGVDLSLRNLRLSFGVIGRLPRFVPVGVMALALHSQLRLGAGTKASSSLTCSQKPSTTMTANPGKASVSCGPTTASQESR
jgi:hypothetical protein